MGTDVYASAADSSAFLGLGNLFNTSTSTAYGDVTEADMAEWKANVITDAEAISFKVMQTIRRTAKVGQSKDAKPNIYITTDALKDGFEPEICCYCSSCKCGDMLEMNILIHNFLSFIGYPRSLNRGIMLITCTGTGL